MGKKRNIKIVVYFFLAQVKDENIKVLTVTVIRAKGVKVGGFQFLDCELKYIA